MRKIDQILIEGGHKMNRKRLTESQIVSASQQAENGIPVTGVTGRIQVSESSFYRWKKKFSGPGVSKIYIEAVGS